MSTYDLIVNEKWDEAIEMASLEYEKTKSIGKLMNLFPALIVKEKFNNCLRVVEEVWRVSGKDSESEFEWAAIANVGLGNIDLAIELLEDSRNCKYSDPTGGVEIESLIYALSVLTNNNEKKLKSSKNIEKLLIKNRNAGIWPGPIGGYLLDDIEFTTVISLLSDIESLRKKESCQAYFYKGIKELENGSRMKCLETLNECMKFTPQSFFIPEYHLSKLIGKLLNENNQMADLV